VAQHAETIPLPFKRYQIAPVWRAEGAQKGRFREFYQCDADIVGSSSIVADAEIIQMIEATLTALGFESFTVRVNNRKILDAMLVAAGVPVEHHIPTLRILDKLEKVGRDNVQGEMESQLDIPMETSGNLMKLVDSVTTDGMNALRGLVDEDGLNELASTLELVRLLVVNPERVVFDPSVARGLDYYTGNVFETQLTDAPKFGSVMSGGRYDGLVGMFLGRDVPAVGVSLGVDRLFAAMEELELVDTTTKVSADYMVAVLGEDQLPYALRAVKTLREGGKSVYLYPGVVDVRKQLRHAATLGIPKVAIIGESEMAAETVTVRNMQSRNQEVVPLAEL
jgi:histidyl-tRNA synthetase